MTLTYKKGDRILPSVTTIIGEASNKDALIQWAANSTVEYLKSNYESLEYMCVDEHFNNARFEYRRLSKEALDIGSEAHSIIETAIKDKVIYESDREEVNNCVHAFEKWLHDNDVMTIESERTVYGGSWAGTLDLECEVEGVHTIVDFKTSKAIYLDSYGPQLAAYWSVTDAKEAGILRLDKESGEYEYKRLKKKALEKYLKIFNAMVELYFIRHPLIAKRAGYGI